MKKILTLACLTLASLFIFSACMPAAAPSFFSFYPSTNFEEKLEYTITHKEFDPANSTGANTNIKYSFTEGKYIAVLKRVENTFTLETKITSKGSYTLNSVKHDFEDEVSSLVEFLSINNDSKPVKSTKTNKTTSISIVHSEIKILSYNYKTETVYDQKTATVKVNAFNDETQAYDKKLESIPQEKTINKTANVFDNEMLFYLVRIVENSETSSRTFSILDPLTGSKNSILYNTNTAKGVSPLVSETFTINGVEEKDVEVYNKQLKFSNTSFTGPAILVQVRKKDDKLKFNYKPYRITQSLPYDLGDLVYTLSSMTETIS